MNLKELRMSRILDIFRLNPIVADVGLEVEVEATLKLPQLEIGHNNDYWSTHTDGSLRGIAAEYVSKPIEEKDIIPALDCLRFNLKHSQVKNSVRAGVHVHVNCQEMTEDELIKYIALYTIFEIPLVEYCGDSRVGNAFCLRMCDAEGAIDIITSFIRKGVANTVLNDGLRYGALNPISLRKFGTLEFRSLGTQWPFKNIEVWCDILLRLREVSKTFESLAHIIDTFEAEGTEQFTKNIFDKHYKTFFPTFNEQSVLIGFSYVRELTYFSEK